MFFNLFSLLYPLLLKIKLHKEKLHAKYVAKGGTGGGVGWGEGGDLLSVFSVKQSFLKTKTWQPVCVWVKDDIFRKIPHVFGQGLEYTELQTPTHMPSSRQGLERPSPPPPATQAHDIIPRPGQRVPSRDDRQRPSDGKAA